MLWDTHIHSHHSGDSDASPESMVHSAIQKNLDGICFTDHYDYDYPKEPDLFLLDFDNYHSEIEELQHRFASILPILWGVELGLQPQIAEHNRQIASAWPFDFIIGSSHVVHGMDPYYDDYYEAKTEEEAYREYFESILENLHTETDFDVYGHLDYVVRYGPNKNACYSYERYREPVDEILRQLIRLGKGIELNTAGWKYGLGHPNPTEEILVRYRELGGEILTLGSDAHRPQDVACDFGRVRSLLLAAGFKYYTVFRRRKPEFIPIV